MNTYMFGEETFELLVEYTAKWVHGDKEEFHGIHDIGSGYDIQIDKVFIELGGDRIDITKSLSSKQLNQISENITPNL